jgi:hypothetical protein
VNRVGSGEWYERPYAPRGVAVPGFGRGPLRVGHVLVRLRTVPAQTAPVLSRSSETAGAPRSHPPGSGRPPNRVGALSGTGQSERPASAGSLRVWRIIPKNRAYIGSANRQSQCGRQRGSPVFGAGLLSRHRHMPVDWIGTLGSGGTMARATVRAPTQGRLRSPPSAGAVSRNDHGRFTHAPELETTP